jgi:eukaryotic-like serine/threonine-protein kinase
MNSKQWERIKSIFAEAHSMGDDERALFLENACAGDAQLHAEVERLLIHSAAADEFFRTPVTPNSTTKAQPFHSFSEGQLLCERFVVRRFLGSGGMGEVYAADDKVTGVTVALKTIQSEIDDGERLSAAIRKEVQLARRVTHPNVCRIHDLFEHHLEDPVGTLSRSTQILSMELLEGETLAVSLKRGRAFSLSEAIGIARQIAEGLRAVHRAGIVHRDLKPDNVMLVSSEGSDVRAVLTDFGLARIDSKDSSWLGISGLGAILGTPRYMSPEQLQCSTGSVASDIYSFGAIWYEMLTGRNPYESLTTTSTVLRRLTKDAPSPRIFVPSIDSSIEKAILKCLARDPSHRFADAADLLSWFDRYCGSHSSKPFAVKSSGGSTSTSDGARQLHSGPISAAERALNPARHAGKTILLRLRMLSGRRSESRSRVETAR